MNPSRPSFSFALRTAIFALVCTMWSINAEAVEAVGKVQFVLGDVTAVNGGESRQLKKMDPIYESDTIETGPKGSTQLMMMDSARIAVRPNSAFIIAEYRLDDDNSASVLSVLKGGFRTLSGKIGEQAKENYRVETPTGIIGLRGTDHAVFHIPEGQEKLYGDGLAGTYSKVYEGSTILQNEDKILVITPATDAGYVAKDAAPQYVKAIPETAEGPVVVAPFDETESDEGAADEAQVAAAPDEESASETESEAEAEIVVADELPAESGDAAAEPREIAPAPAPEPAPEPTSEIARAPNGDPINEIPAETIADAIQRETEESIMEESRNAGLAEFELTHFNGALREGGFVQNNPYFRIERTTGIDTSQSVRFRIAGADANEFTLETISGSPNHNGMAVGCDGTSCAVLFLPGDAFHEFRIHPTADGIVEGSEQWRIEVINVEEVAVIPDFRDPDFPIRNIIPFDVTDEVVDVTDEVVVAQFELTHFNGALSEGGFIRNNPYFRIERTTGIDTSQSVRFRIAGADANEFTLETIGGSITRGPAVSCDGTSCTALFFPGDEFHEFRIHPTADGIAEGSEQWRIEVINVEEVAVIPDFRDPDFPIRNIIPFDVADGEVEVSTFSVDDTGREEESFQIRVETARPVRSEGQIRFRINGADRDEIGDLPTGVTYSTENGVYSATLPAGEREFAFTLTPLYDEQPDAENWRIVLVDDNPRIFVEDSVQLEWNIAIADAADVDVFTFSVDATGREGESFQISGETTARTVRNGGQIQFRIIGANPNEFTMSPGVACNSIGICTATLPVGEREFAFTLTPLYDERPDAENWRIVLVDDNPRIFVGDSVQLEWNIAIADIVAEVQIANTLARTTFDEGESLQLRISSSQTSPADGRGLQVRFRINGADRNEIGDLPPNIRYSAEADVYSATIPAGQREFTFNLIILRDSTDETSGEEWTVTLISDTGLYTGNSQVAFTVIDFLPANFFVGEFATLTNPDASLNLAVPTDWIIGSGGILASQDPDRMRFSPTAPETGIDIFPGGAVYNAIAAGDESYVRFASGQNVFYRMDSDGRFVNNIEGNAGRLSRQGEGGSDYFTFSYALESGDRTYLTNYQVETRFFLNARASDGIPDNEAREFNEGAAETWQFGTTTRTELHRAETFFPVTGTVENLQANLDYGRVPVPNPEGTDFVPGSFDYDISGQASFGTDNSKIFSRFDVQVDDAEACRSGNTRCYDDRLVGKFEADANP